MSTALRKREVEVYAKVVVLAASCVETAHIMLNSKSRHWPTGIANSSGQLGRNLCEHLYGSPGYGYLPQLLGQPPAPDNIADSTVAWMPRWQNLKNPREEKFIRGYSVYMGGGCGNSLDTTARSKALAPQFKRDIKRYYPTSDRCPHPGADSSQSRPTTSTSIRKERYLRHPPASISFSVGTK